MTLTKIPLTTKLFAVIVMTALLVVATMAVLIASSMRDGFSQYLLRGELVGLQHLSETLAEQHDDTQPGWPQFQNSPTAWLTFTEEHFREWRGQTPPKAPMPIGERLSLLDAAGQLIIGPSFDENPSERRAIYGLDQPNPTRPIGWLGLSAPPGAPSVTDAFYLRGQIQSLVLASLIAIAISTLAALLLARQFLAPIHALEAGAKTLASGDYAARIPNDRNDELGQLIDHYNDLALSLEAAEIAEKQWVSDTSHELQTPLAVLRAQIEAVQDGVRNADEKTLAAMHGAVLRLTRLVNDLRMLSRDREHGFHAQSQPEHIAQILDDASTAIAKRFKAAELEFSQQVETPLIVNCDAQRIRQVIDNLLENALRYTDAPGSVRLSAWAAGSSVHIKLSDTAPAPSADAMPQLFDRFYRQDASRSRALGGSGLGLSICKAIVTAHGGSITAAPSDMGGLDVQITLPTQGKRT